MEQTPDTNQPLSAQANRWMFQTWIDALTKPNQAFYSELGKSPNATTKTAWLWVFIGTLLGGVIGGVLSLIFGTQGLGQLANMLGGSELGGEFVMPAVTGGVAGLLCGAPAGALLGTLGFGIGVYIQNWLAKLLGGEGPVDAFAYVSAAYTAPLAAISSVLGAIPLIGVIGSLVSLYGLYLNVLTLHSVKQLSWGKAVLVLLIPLVVVGLLVGCLLLLLGPAIAAVYMDAMGQ